MSRRSWPEIVGAAIAELVVNTLLSLLFGFWLMLAVGVVHHEWIRQCPTIGYFWSVVLVSLIRGALYQLPERGAS